jgi:hypothetical protein
MINMDIFDLLQEQFEKELDNLFTNISEKDLLKELIDDNICYETSCLHNSGCDTFEFDGSAPRCLECEKDCPYKIESVDAF